MQIEQSQTDRSRKRFFPIKLAFRGDQVLVACHQNHHQDCHRIRIIWIVIITKQGIGDNLDPCLPTSQCGCPSAACTSPRRRWTTCGRRGDPTRSRGFSSWWSPSRPSCSAPTTPRWRCPSSASPPRGSSSGWEVSIFKKDKFDFDFWGVEPRFVWTRAGGFVEQAGRERHGLSYAQFLPFLELFVLQKSYINWSNNLVVEMFAIVCSI